MSIPSEINTELNTLNSTKTAIRNAIEDKGVTVETDASFSDYADLIEDNLCLIPTDTLNIVTNDTYDVTNYVSVTVNVPTDDISYNAWQDRVLSTYSDDTVDTTKYYEINTQESMPTNWTKGDFRNVRVLRYAYGNYFLGKNSITYDNIRFDNLRHINVYAPNTTDAYSAATGSYSFSFRNGIALAFPELLFANLGQYAFSNNTGVTYSFPKLTRLIGQYAFYNNSGINFSFPALTQIDNYAFQNCSNCTFSFPELVKIGSGSFSNYQGSLTLTLPKCTTFITPPYPSNNTSYTNTYNLTATGEIGISTVPTNHSSNKGSVVINIPNATGLSLFFSSHYNASYYSNTTINAPNVTATHSEGSGFCQYLDANNISVVQSILNNLQVINGNNPFSYCTLSELTLPNVTTLNCSYFGRYGSITKVNLPSCTTINNQYAFRYASSITEIHFASANRSAIEATTGYSNVWGLGSGNCTVYFDL